MGEFGLPPDGVAWAALGCALLWLGCVVDANRRARLWTLCERHHRVALWGLALGAALLSLGYIAFYLRGGPRIIDATAYYQQARIFASGQLTSPAFEPSAATRGRFLYFDPARNSLAILFPPGYAALLSLGIWLRSEALIGCSIAVALVISTARLARSLYQRTDAALLAGLFSATTMVLRYHTADTMSHGLSALLVTLAAWGTLRADRVGGGLTGLSLGWLLATRPTTFLPVALLCAWYFFRHSRRPRFALACGLASLPGCALWLAYQWKSTGSLLQLTQLAYYAVADGPPGCFRYGFGKGIGCLFEHGEYVAKRLANGYGALQAAFVTVLRLRWHSLDVHNFEPLVLATIAALGKALKAREPRLLGLTIVGVVLAYLPFYFDGSYPGGGARLFVDVVPLEHVLVAGWLVRRGWSHWFVPLSFAGFACHGAFEHAKLRDRDGGRPMFEAKVLADAGIKRGLVFVDTDHGFLLGHDPSARDAKRGLVVLRHHGDAHDRVAWQLLGEPATYRYVFDPTERVAQARIAPLRADELLTRKRFEAESQWPALAVSQGWVRPVYPPNACSSSRRGLSLEPTHGGARAQLGLYAETAGTARLVFGFVARAGGHQRLSVQIGEREVFVEREAQAHDCFTLELSDIPIRRGEQPLIVGTGPLGIVVDYWSFEEVRP